MSVDPDARDLADKLNQAIADTLNTHDGSMLGRWVFVAEVIDNDGQRTTFLAAPDGQAPWESVGLLHFGRMAEQAAFNEE